MGGPIAVWAIHVFKVFLLFWPPFSGRNPEKPNYPHFWGKLLTNSQVYPACYFSHVLKVMGDEISQISKHWKMREHTGRSRMKMIIVEAARCSEGCTVMTESRLTPAHYTLLYIYTRLCSEQGSETSMCNALPAISPMHCIAPISVHNITSMCSSQPTGYHFCCRLACTVKWLLSFMDVTHRHPL